MNLHLNVARAVFQADGKPDTEVRVLPDPSGGVSFSINFGGTDVMNSGFIPPERELQLAESLQFIADTIGARVPGRLSPFTRGWISTAADIHHTAKSKGFWEDGVERNNGEMLCLIHSEISEALEALRHGNPPDDKIPEFTGVETELADAVIRIMDLAHARGWRVAQAIEAKMKFNNGRPYKHGKEFCLDPRAALVAAKLSGKLSVVLGIGRLDYAGRFQPFGQAEFDATVYQGPDGFWVAKAEKAAVPYEHPSPRIVTHVGMYLYDRWLIDEIPKVRTMTDSDVATIDVEYPLPETL